MKATKSALWAVQRQEFPDSVRIEPHEALMWCEEVKTTDERLRRYMSVACALQYPNGFFYYIAATTYRGYRFGLRPEDYLSF
jgi:hypothetical protein